LMKNYSWPAFFFFVFFIFVLRFAACMFYTMQKFQDV